MANGDIIALAEASAAYAGNGEESRWNISRIEMLCGVPWARQRGKIALAFNYQPNEKTM